MSMNDFLFDITFNKKNIGLSKIVVKLFQKDKLQEVFYINVLNPYDYIFANFLNIFHFNF